MRRVPNPSDRWNLPSHPAFRWLRNDETVPDKSVLNLDAFLGTIAVGKSLTDFELPNVFERALQLTCHNPVAMSGSSVHSCHRRDTKRATGQIAH
ncbi:hypothetical protein NPIL_106131 [Nephila pilipes]|uniref:Uncharacterized protein n=1 Tax=Nephila pilipes TaxID=299642 RepID=A0A8X6QRB9_NEPPI|nr:hypothetical protein NPIL_106131 [Nephila pilipes]